ncbi:hypothetical protein DJ71_18000 [Halorubrum sp. E3]|uniref:STAS/SEC14 domain-containing protein n=1 Tax=Halorubrum persicum TaxID=1383844 RepID=A0A2G1WLF6_9EURY|nr:hypothetical protein [Halorubrum persicum]OYR76972.1 hypothetical protein DJ71_18000 [Halorubrum sp. E3]PHQ39807.1 hypothetical protein DJ69_04595 [Halorubrum persicum]
MEPSERWSIRVDDGVIVVELPHGTGLSPSDGERLLDRWQTLVADRRVHAVVLVVRTTRPCSDAGRRTLRRTARAAADRGVTRFAVAAERPKRQYLERTMDVEGIDPEPFNDAAAAMRWAKCPSEPTVSAVSE